MVRNLNFPQNLAYVLNEWSQCVFTRKPLRMRIAMTREEYINIFQAWNFIKKIYQHRCILMNIATFLRTSIFTEYLQLLLLYWKPSKKKLFGLNLSTGKRPSTKNLFTCVRDMELGQWLTCHLNFLKI